MKECNLSRSRWFFCAWYIFDRTNNINIKKLCILYASLCKLSHQLISSEQWYLMLNADFDHYYVFILFCIRCVKTKMSYRDKEKHNIKRRSIIPVSDRKWPPVSVALWYSRVVAISLLWWIWNLFEFHLFKQWTRGKLPDVLFLEGCPKICANWTLVVCYLSCPCQKCTIVSCCRMKKCL